MDNLSIRIERIIKRVEKIKRNEKIFVIIGEAEFEIELNNDHYLFTINNENFELKTIHQLKKKIFEIFNVFYFEYDEFNIEIEVRKDDLFFVCNDVANDIQSVFRMNNSEFSELKKMVENV